MRVLSELFLSHKFQIFHNEKLKRTYMTLIVKAGP